MTLVAPRDNHEQLAVEALSAEHQRKMAMLVLAGWTFRWMADDKYYWHWRVELPTGGTTIHTRSTLLAAVIAAWDGVLLR